MKSFLMLLIACFATLATFAQKSKGNPTNSKNSTKVQVQYTCPMHSDVVSDKPGKCPKCNMDLSLSKKEQMKREVTKTYTCPVHSEVVSDHAGTCPTCKEQLVVDRRGSKQGKKIYSCSMHPEVSSDRSGKCPICNMELAETKTTSKSKKNK